jgi:hypothetical protein
MDISTGGVFFLWLMLLWPVLVVVIYYSLFRPSLSHPNVLGVTSVVIGYVIPGLILRLVEKIIGINSSVIFLIGIITPVATTHALALVFSTKAKKLVKSDDENA